MSVQYLTDQDGNKTAVLISLKDWEIIKKKLQEFQFKDQMKGVLADVEDFKAGNLETYPLKDLLDEL
ncbi:hypothetical protein [Membranihabitans maritimus]|uniref:hypothetical protein n=1 Tax=Membranihabitans maritimus TaxID=2904244 RepID=UPI001F37CE65|nr:hypothetical protein [Membranihabitans maritimus]